MTVAEVPLGQVTRGVTTWDPARSGDSEFVYIDIAAVDQEAKLISGARCVPTAEAPSRARQIVRAGDVLVSTVRPNLNAVARVEKLLDGATASTGFAVLRPAECLDGRYLFHWVRSPRFVDDMVRKATGASYPAVSDRIIADSTISLPPIEEQRRIADILDRADALRAQRREALALLDDLAQSIFLDMFGNVDDVSTSQLGELLTFVTSGGRGWAKYYADSGRPFIRSLDVRTNAIELVDAAYVRPPDNAEARRTEVRAEDVLLTITGSLIGRAASVPRTLRGAYISQHVAILRPDHEKLRSTYLSHFLNLPTGGQRQIAAMQYGQTKPGLNFDQIRKFEIPLPPLSRQNDYLHRVECIDRYRQTAMDQQRQLNEMFAGLQQRAFAGVL